MATFIEPKILKGFRDFLPQQELFRRSLSEKLERVFRLFGFVPIDTPALEYTEILLGKGGGETDKQVYRFTDHGGRDVALRYDLTVPFARYLAQHRAELALPFKRYHIAKVWRGENSQKGRYREFTQCDFDIVGTESAAADFEILLLILESLRALDVGGVTVHVNHRGLFNRFLAKLELAGKSADILRAVDKLAKIGAEETEKLLASLAGAEKARSILQFIQAAGSFEEILVNIEQNLGGKTPETERLRLIYGFIAETGNEKRFVLDPSITRGLDYYTGVVCETFLDAMPGIGSVCSGGRYDNLAGLYAKEPLSGIGASIGLDRLIAALESLDGQAAKSGVSDLVVCALREADAGKYQRLAGRFREHGVCCEVVPAAAGGTDAASAPDAAADTKLLTKQFVLAEKKGAAWVLLPAVPFEDGVWTLRNLAKRENKEGLSFEECLREIAPRSKG